MAQNYGQEAPYEHPRGDLSAALAYASEAVREHDRLPLPFELGRTLLVKGAVERRAKQKREARESLTRALNTFEGLGAPLWTCWTPPVTTSR